VYICLTKVSEVEYGKTLKLKKNAYTWDVTYTADKNDKEVKKGYVKANKKYPAKLYSVSVYKQSNKSKRYMLNYAVCNKKGKRIKNVKLKELSYEEYCVIFHVCNDGVNGVGVDTKCYMMKRICKEKKFEMGREGCLKKQLIKPTTKKIDEVLYEYGWYSTCG
jgi:hypothetical protein